ncbi:Ribonuclease HI [Desulfocicer vacuolatum DSM 3385]|uniref:Ribonuclease H n=1 Tax=Desulfocicer vacuolatum DSM 3385 TaxID=1121400 RepID=A0A1W2B9S2_9BACT|nr:ribonuclease HI [Desulfocicer vacuolatum]SMC69462.1 Ribonuclease HI [Desulfocicer vacuolatum DSM 3385]
MQTEMELLRIYIGESQKYGRKPLYEAIVEEAHKFGLAGATVTRGIMGFGKHSEIRTSKILRLSQDLPLVIEIVDAPHRLAQFVPVLNDMITQGLVVSEKVNVLIDRHGREEPKKSSPVPGKKSPGMSTDDIHIYTDGSAIGNPGPGGYGIILILDGETMEFAQGFQYTTNNRMEMLAVITALEKIPDIHRNRKVIVHSDSQYTINGITKGWAKSWKKRGWKKADGKPALNPDLWKRMLAVTEQYSGLTFKWIKGHAGHPLNERVDELANRSARSSVGLLVDEGYTRA